MIHSVDSSNEQFRLAAQFVNFTDQHIFLTGKAGSGKTTFLKYIKEHSPKKLAVVAPTGVAAINAGGVTIHSFFQLPFGSYIPDLKIGEADIEGNFFNKQSLLRQLRLNGEKRQLINELDLLIIDEVSMVRADILDAIDTVLRSVRRKPSLPFGGVQMLYIGDLFQLPPVINDREWEILAQYYPGGFFFHAQILKETPPLYLELKKIYRQSDINFISLLNNIRNNQLEKQDLDLLGKYYKPDFKPEKKGEYITLTTHNSKADVINQSELKKLSSKLHTFKASIEADFGDKAHPAEANLQLKEGAQIMFLRNDKGESKRYYNGKLGTVKKIEGEKIHVIFPDSNELTLEKETWKNVRYRFNPDIDGIEEEVLGTFTQYPVRLAWAITIHKSQGLTFDKAIIDAGDSFAPGQVYVALSRLRSLEGLVLYSRIQPDCISSDKQAIDFSKTEPEAEKLNQQFKEAQKQFVHTRLMNAFDWNKLVEVIKIFYQEMDEHKIPDQETAKLFIGALVKAAASQQQTAEKFQKQLEQMLPGSETDGYKFLYERIEAANKYLSEHLHVSLFVPLQEHLDGMSMKAKVKKYLKALGTLAAVVKNKKQQMEHALQIVAGLKEGSDVSELLGKIATDKKELQVELKNEKSKTKPQKGESHLLSLKLFKEGKSIAEIASERSLAIGTVEGHLISFIPTGQLDVSNLVSKEKMEQIQKAIEALGEVSSSLIKEKLGEAYSYGEIRAVQNFNSRLKSGEIKKV